jgi:hypothetical protein
MLKTERRLSLSYCIIVFLILALPYKIWMLMSAQRYDLVTNKTIYQFYASQGWSDPRPFDHGPDPEIDGYIYATELYGRPSDNSESVIVAISRNPTAFFERVWKNTQALIDLLINPNRQFLQKFVIYLLFFLPFTLKSVWGDKIQFTSLCFLLGSIGTMGMFLLFHIDPRYITMFIPFFVVTFTSIAANMYKLPVFKLLSPQLIGIALCAFLAFQVPDFWLAVDRTLTKTPLDLSPLRELADRFISLTRPTLDQRRHMVVWLNNQKEPEDNFMFYYFAGIPHVSRRYNYSLYPRDRIFSFRTSQYTHSVSIVEGDTAKLPEMNTRSGEDLVVLGRVSIARVGQFEVSEFCQ